MLISAYARYFDRVMLCCALLQEATLTLCDERRAICSGACASRRALPYLMTCVLTVINPDTFGLSMRYFLDAPCDPAA